MSSRLVSQQPSRKNPVMGFIEQSSSRSPRTFRGPVGRSPLFQLSSLSIVVSWVAAMSDSSGGDFLLPLGSTGNRRGMTTTRHRGYRISNRYEKRYNLHWIWRSDRYLLLGPRGSLLGGLGPLQLPPDHRTATSAVRSRKSSKSRSRWDLPVPSPTSFANSPKRASITQAPRLRRARKPGAPGK